MMRGSGGGTEDGIGAGRRGFLLDATSGVDQPWRPPLSYGRHQALLPAGHHTTIRQHARQQVSIVKTRK